MDNREEAEPQKNIYIIKCVYEHYLHSWKIQKPQLWTRTAGVAFVQKSRKMKILSLKSFQYIFEISDNIWRQTV